MRKERFKREEKKKRTKKQKRMMWGSRKKLEDHRKDKEFRSHDVDLQNRPDGDFALPRKSAQQRTVDGVGKGNSNGAGTIEEVHKKDAMSKTRAWQFDTPGPTSSVHNQTAQNPQRGIFRIPLKPVQPVKRNYTSAHDESREHLLKELREFEFLYTL
jgi:hypothetical protein